MAGPVKELHTPPRGDPFIRGSPTTGRARRVRRVCKACNNGWMSRLETAARPILRPMLKGIGRPISQKDQGTLATWAVKTAMMLEFLDTEHMPVIPKEHYHFLKAEQLPPADTAVFLGAYRGGRYDGYYWLQTLRLPDKPESPIRPNAYFATLCVGHVVLQVVGITIPGFTLENRMPNVFTRIWPADVPSVLWPPRVALGDRELELVSKSPLPLMSTPQDMG